MTTHRLAAIPVGAFVGVAGPAVSARGGAEQSPAGGARPAVSTEQGFGIFQQRCVGCHGNAAFEKAAAPAALREMTPERILESLSTGVMKSVGDTLTADQRRLVSESVAGRLMGTSVSGDARSMPNICATNPPLTGALAGPSWNGWGADVSNSRFQPARAAALDAAKVPKLKLKWAFGFPNGTSVYGQPTVVGGRVFIGTDTGYL